jgi:hypothetical protein
LQIAREIARIHRRRIGRDAEENSAHSLSVTSRRRRSGRGE